MHKTSFVLAAFLVTSAFAETAIPCRGGTLAFERLAVEFSPSVVYCGWKGRAKVVPVDAVDFAFALEKPKANVNGTLLTQPRDGGKLEATWRFRPDRDIYVEELNAFANLPTAIYAGGWVEVDGARKELSREEGKNFNGRVRRLVFHDANGDETFTVEFPKGQEVSIVDCRPYRCPWFDLRLQGGRRHAANEAAVVTAVFSLPKGECFRLSGTGPVTMTPGAEWLPVARAKAIAPGSAADFTAMATAVSGVPAGKWGYPVVRDGHVEFERRPGVEQRFYGVNICYQANFPEPDEAERLATMLVAYGYNSVRLHHYDNKVLENLDRFDDLIDACVRHGLYLTTDLYVSRFPARWPKDDMKWMILFDDECQDDFVSFVRRLLDHRSRHTGRRLAEEPALGFISLVNEGLLSHRDAPAAESEAGRAADRRWRAWIGAEHAAGRHLRAPESFPAGITENRIAMKAPESDAVRAFYAAVEGAFARRMRKLLRGELGCKALLTSLNSGRPPKEYDAFRLTEFDYVDTHYYWDHPCAADPGGSLWGVPQRLQHGTSPLRYCRGYRSGPLLAGQPFTVTEFNYCNPGRYRACSALLVGALSAQGDWSGAWRFDWGCSKGGIGEPWRQEAGRFQVGGDPVVLAGERLATALFLRGDLVPSKGRTFGTGDGVVVNEAAGSLTVATDRACGGFVEKGGFEAGALRVDVGLDASCVGVISLSRDAIRTSRRLLLLHLTDGVAGGSRFRDARRNVIENNGSRDVHLLRAGTAKVSLALASGVWRVWALDATGARRRRLPAVFAAGRLEFEITTGCRTGDATYQYEIALD